MHQESKRIFGWLWNLYFILKLFDSAYNSIENSQNEEILVSISSCPYKTAWLSTRGIQMVVLHLETSMLINRQSDMHFIGTWMYSFGWNGLRKDNSNSCCTEQDFNRDFLFSFDYLSFIIVESMERRSRTILWQYVMYSTDGRPRGAQGDNQKSIFLIGSIMNSILPLQQHYWLFLIRLLWQKSSFLRQENGVWLLLMKLWGIEIEEKHKEEIDWRIWIPSYIELSIKISSLFRSFYYQEHPFKYWKNRTFNSLEQFVRIIFIIESMLWNVFANTRFISKLFLEWFCCMNLNMVKMIVYSIKNWFITKKWICFSNCYCYEEKM